MKKFCEKQTVISILAVVSLVFLSIILLHVTGMGKFYYTDISDQAVGTIIDADGVVKEKNLKAADWNLGPEETLKIELQLPEHAVYEGMNAVVFNEYNAEITVKYNDRVLAKDGTGIAEKGNLIGDELVHFEIPQDAWGKTVEIEIVSKEKTVNSFTSVMRLMPASDVRLSPLINHELSFLLFTIVLLASIVIVLQYLFAWIIRHRLNSGLFLFLFTMLVSVWYLGYNRAFYVLSASVRFNATVEYYAIYTAFIPLMIYFGLVSSESRFRRFSWIMVWVFSIYAAVSMGLSVSHVPLNLSDLMHGCRLLEVIMILGFVVRGITIRKEKMSQEKLVIRGFGIGAAISLLEIVALTLRSVSAIPIWLQPVLYLDYASIGILMFIAILFVSYMSEMQERREMEIRQEALSRLAFADQMTGIPNRAFMIHTLQEMHDLPADLTAVFMDVDHLKTANDDYGHTTGDKLISTMAELIQEAYMKAGGKDDLYARWGGDEFVAYFRDRETAETFESILQNSLKEINKRHMFPFEAAVSIGMSTVKMNADGTPRTPDQLLSEADENMYRKKASQHLSEGALR